MADRHVEEIRSDDKNLYVDWLEDILHAEFNLIQAAVDRMETFHQDTAGKDIVNDAKILRVLLDQAKAKIMEFDKSIADHFGQVGVYRAARGHETMAFEKIAGIRFIPKEAANG